jgi:hypothetical protein
MFKPRINEGRRVDQTFFITINPNKPTTPENIRAQYSKFTKELEEFYSNLDQFINVIVGPKGHHQKGDLPLERYLTAEPKVDVNPQVGEKHKTLHSHTTVQLQSEPDVFFSFDLPKIRKFFRQPDGTTYYVNVKYVSNPVNALARYQTREL